ncbi:MAG: universal stress protein [Alphaproteobacteria bacterium]
MAIKSILVSLDGTETSTATLATAFQVVQRFKVHADVLHVRPDSLTSVPAIGEGMNPRLAEDFARDHEKTSQGRSDAARRVFDDLCGRNGIAVVESGPTRDGVSASFIEKVGRRHLVMTRLGRVHDLIVVNHPTNRRDLAHSMTIYALFDTGRPVLVVPKKAPTVMGDVIAIAWNGSAECARAVASATNFFPFAKKVFILTADSERTPLSVVPELASYLECHGVPVETRVFAHMGRRHLGGKRLLKAVAEVGADLLVMGAHRVAPLTEFILGSATRQVLEGADIPILMQH